MKVLLGTRGEGDKGDRDAAAAAAEQSKLKHIFWKHSWRDPPLGGREKEEKQCRCLPTVPAYLVTAKDRENPGAASLPMRQIPLLSQLR